MYNLSEYKRESSFSGLFARKDVHLNSEIHKLLVLTQQTYTLCDCSPSSGTEIETILTSGSVKEQCGTGPDGYTSKPNTVKCSAS